MAILLTIKRLSKRQYLWWWCWKFCGILSNRMKLQKFNFKVNQHYVLFIYFPLFKSHSNSIVTMKKDIQVLLIKTKYVGIYQQMAVISESCLSNDTPAKTILINLLKYIEYSSWWSLKRRSPQLSWVCPYKPVGIWQLIYFDDFIRVPLLSIIDNISSILDNNSGFSTISSDADYVVLQQPILISSFIIPQLSK